MRRPVRPRRDERRTVSREAQNRVDLAGLDGLLQRQLRQDGRDALGQHRLARTRRANHQDVVPARARHFHRPLGVLLAADLRQVHFMAPGPAEFRLRVHRHPVQLLLPVQVLDHLRKRVRRQDGNLFRHRRGLGGVFSGKDQAAEPLPAPHARGDGERALDRLHPPVQGELAQQQMAVQPIPRDDPRGPENPHGDGQVERRAFFPDVGGGQIHGDLLQGELKAGVLHGRGDPVARLLHRRVGQADGRKGGQAGGEIDLDLHREGLDAENSGG